MIGSTPPATVCQAAFGLLRYHRGQVLRGAVAAAQPHRAVAEEVSAAQRCYAVQRELPPVSVLGPPALGVTADAEPLAPEALRQRLPALLSPRWTPRWRKAVNTQPRPQVAKAQPSGAHTSRHRRLAAARQDPRPEMAAA